MPETVVTSPYGDITVMHPDGASHDEIINYAKQNAKQNKAVGPDVAQSMMAAPRKVVEGVLGLPGMLGNAMQSGVNSAMDLATGTPLTAEQKNIIPKLPEASDIQAQTSKVIGPSYQPQTTEGKFAGAATEGLTGGLAGAGPKVASGIAGIVSGLGAEGAGHMVDPDSFWHMPAQILGGLAGGISSLLGGKAVQGVRNYSAGNNIGDEVGKVIGDGPVSSGAVRRLASDVSADNLTPQAVHETAQALGPEARLLDTGRQFNQTATLGLGTIPGQAQSQIADMAQGRTGQLLKTGKYEPGANSSVRLNQDFDQTMGPVKDMVQLQKEIHDTYHAPTQAAYKKVMGQYDDIGVPASITERPAIASAMGGAEELAKNYGVTPKAGSLEYWDYVKKNLDRRINGLVRTGTDSQGSADLGGLLDAKRNLVSYLDNATKDVAGNSQYAFARKLSATEKGMGEAAEFGPTMFNNRVLPEVAKQQFDDLSIAEQAIAKASIRRELDRQMGSVGNDAAKAKGLFGQNNVLEKTAAIFGDDAASTIKSAVEREHAFQDTTNKLANSLTQPRQEVVKTIPGAGAPPQIHLGNIIDRAVTGGPQLLANALHGVGGQNSQQGMARMLLSQGDDIPTIVKLLNQYNTKAAGNQSAPIGSQLQAITRALMAQGAGQ